MLNSKDQQEFKQDAESGNYTIQDLRDKYDLSMVEFKRLRTKLGVRIKDGVKNFSESDIRFIREHLDMSVLALSNITGIPYQKVKKIKENFKQVI